MLQLRYLFGGGLGADHVTAALLAMAFEGVRAFRKHFLGLVLPDEADALSKQAWSVKVEDDHVDVRMDTAGLAILIKNTIAHNDPKQVVQLLRYYQKEIKKQRKAESASRIIAVYLAPKQPDMDEVTEVTNAPEFRPDAGDMAPHVPWEQMIAYVPRDNDPDDALVGSAMEQIRGVIEAARPPK